MSDPRSHEIICPCCGASIIFDLDTATILAHVPPKKERLSFEEAVQEVEAGKEKVATRFDRAMEERTRRSEILDKKFKHALEKAADDKGPPEKPFDLD